jgi:hypothetical protein
MMAFRRWTKFMSHQWSNGRELIAIHHALEAFARMIQKHKITTIQLFSSNLTETYNINRKAAAMILYKSILRLLSLTTTLGMTLIAAYIQGICCNHAD